MVAWVIIIWWCGSGEPSSRPVNPVMLNCHSFARRRRWLNYTFNVMVALRGCRAVKFDSCNDLWSSVHTTCMLVIVLSV